MPTRNNGTLGVLMDLVYPPLEVPSELPAIRHPFCRVCGEPFAGLVPGPFQCGNCRSRIWHIDSARTVYRGDGFVREAIHAFKYDKRFHYLAILAQWLEEGYKRHFAGRNRIDALVPVPLHAIRWKERGFNQALELARELSRATGAPIRDLLERVKPTATQSRLSRAERLRNVRLAFALKKPADLRKERLLIIDDVFTTGATVNDCARELKKSGARRVDALTVARG